MFFVVCVKVFEGYSLVGSLCEFFIVFFELYWVIVVVGEYVGYFGLVLE